MIVLPSLATKNHSLFASAQICMEANRLESTEHDQTGLVDGVPIAVEMRSVPVKAVTAECVHSRQDNKQVDSLSHLHKSSRSYCYLTY
jgi:hypothetical protein